MIIPKKLIREVKEKECENFFFLFVYPIFCRFYNFFLLKNMNVGKLDKKLS